MLAESEQLKKTRLVWKSPSHRFQLKMDPSALTRSVDRDSRRRPPAVPYTSSPVRPGSVPASSNRYQSHSNGSHYSSTPSPVDNDRGSNRRRTHFCDGVDTHGRHFGEPQRPDPCARDTVHECGVIRRRCASAEDLERRLEHTQAEAAMLEANRRELLCKLREAELDGRAAARQVAELQELVKNLRKNESNQTSSADVANLSRQKEELLHRLEVFEESNRHLRDLLRTADVETGRLKASESERENAKRQILLLETENARLTKQLADCEASRASLQRQFHAREADCERLTVQLKNVEKKYGRDAQEVMANYEQLKRATRAWKSKWQKAESDLEELQRQLQCVDSEASEKTRELHQRLEASEQERERLMCQVEDMSKRVKDMDGMLMMSRSGERELTTEMGVMDRRLRDACGEVEMLKRRNCELIAELEAAADREVQSRMSQEQAGREFDVLRERMATRCVELEELVAKLKNGGVSAAEARDCVLEMRLQRAIDELEATRAKYGQAIHRLEDCQMMLDQTKATNRSLLDYIARLRKSYNDNFGHLAAEACSNINIH